MICRFDAYSLKYCERGAALVEFAMLLPVLCLLIIGTLEVGYRIYAVSVSNGAIRAAARMASTGQYTGTQIDAEVVKQIRSFRKDATVSIVKKSYSDFTGVGLPEPVTSGSIASGTYCFDDINNNGTWDADRGKNGLGGAEDVIYYEVTATYPTLFKFSEKMLKFSPTTKIVENTIVSNEPYAAVVSTSPPKVCK
ncbi:TadE/TadG family type IV pilus assembly protein [Sphingomonas daechungensis]|uniref:TadE/TadG family type IV pilus assembly protein n=1 Tax=Sphingomonas daechungensis TaxID=1176646 RepID=UPI00378515A7